MVLELTQLGCYYVKFDKYGDDIICSKPFVNILNLIFGTTYLDLDGKVNALNRTNNQTLEMDFEKKGWTTPSQLSGYACSATGEKLIKVEGCWYDTITVTNVRTN